MRLLLLANFAAVALAAPQVTANDLTNGKCGDIIFIMARASTEPGNMGGSMGPRVCSGLKTAYPGKVACQGVGSPYSAGLADNVLPGGTTQAAIKKAQSLFTTAAEKCPEATIVFGGYSQGTAVMHNAVKGLPENVKARLAGGVLFGDTRNKQDKGQIPSFPKDKIHIYCDKSDGVCGGALMVTGGHFAYVGNGDGKKAVDFLKEKISEFKGGKVSSSGQASEKPSGKGFGKGMGKGKGKPKEPEPEAEAES